MLLTGRRAARRILLRYRRRLAHSRGLIRREFADEIQHGRRIGADPLRAGLDTRFAQQGLGVLALLGQDDRHHIAGLPGTCGATGAVQVSLVLGRRIAVDDQFDVIDVDAPRGDVGGDQNPGRPADEGGQVAVTGRLRQVPVQVHRGDA